MFGISGRLSLSVYDARVFGGLPAWRLSLVPTVMSGLGQQKLTAGLGRGISTLSAGSAESH
jgi:hypothetical protein